MNNAWKQPIPVGLDAEFNNDYAAVAMYMMLIYRASNDTRIIRIPYTTRESTVTIQRGQCLFSRRQFALYLGWSEKKCERVLKDLINFYQKVTSERTNNMTLVTLLNYESIISFDHRREDEGKTKGNRREVDDTNLRVIKSDKSVKSEKKIHTKTTKVSLPDKHEQVDHATQSPSIPLLLHALTMAAINKSPVDKDVIIASYKRYAKQIKESLIGVSPEELVYMILWARDEDSQPLAWFEEKKTLPKPATIAELIARYRPHAYPSDPTENARWIKGLEQCGLYVTHELFTTPY